MLLFFLLLKIFFAEQLPFTSLHWKLIFGYFLLLSVAVLVYPVFRKMRDQDRWSIQNGAIEIEEGVLHLSVVRGRETRRLNVEIKNKTQSLDLISIKNHQYKKSGQFERIVHFSSGRRTRTSDLRVMSPTSCQLLHPAIYRLFDANIPLL